MRPKPRVHLTRFHGVFAPNSKHRTMVTGDAIDKQNKLTAIRSPLDGEERRGKMSWAMRLKRVFNIDITVCKHCQGPVRIIACIQDRQVINKILAHINQQQKSLGRSMIGAGIRAPPSESKSLMNQ